MASELLKINGFLFHWLCFAIISAQQLTMKLTIAWIKAVVTLLRVIYPKCTNFKHVISMNE
jgi:hypothetical protein